MLYPEYHKKSYSQRRQNLLQSIKDPNPFLIVIFNSPVYPQCSDAFYRHRTDSSFFYLTGLVEEESAALLWSDGKKTHYQLFVRPRDPLMEQWNGLRLGPAGAKKTLMPDEAFEISELATKVEEWFKKLPKGSLPHIYSNYSSHAPVFEKLLSITKRGQIKAGQVSASGYIEILPYVRQLRLIKDEREIADLKKAAEINVKAHLQLMKQLKPQMTEYQAQAIIEHVYLNEGARGPGYGSILGSASNAAILHYHENSRTMNAGEMLLADAGCEYKMYQSDITRTIPVGKTFTPLQRKLIDIVHEAKDAATAVCVEGRDMQDFHQTASMALIEGLKSLKLLKGTNESIYEKGEHRRYYPHGTGHWLGLDVHDPCPTWDSGESIKFKAGMLLTVEPGLYFMQNDTTVPKEFRGQGVRIEDNLLIRPKGKAPENITENLPSTWKEIESVKKASVKKRR
jgi:Xaa-Pro aminopeptidase